MDNKEYKVITSNTPSFASAEKLRQVLEEEAQAGWDLVEKFDNYKIRLQRDTSARANDGNLSFDPYRSSIGLSSPVYMGIAALATVAVIFIVIYVAAAVAT